MPTSFVNKEEDMEWLNDVWKIPKRYKSAIIYGHEYGPDKVEVYLKKNPLVTDKPKVYEQSYFQKIIDKDRD